MKQRNSALDLTIDTEHARMLIKELTHKAASTQASTPIPHIPAPGTTSFFQALSQALSASDTRTSQFAHHVVAVADYTLERVHEIDDEESALSAAFTTRITGERR